MKLIVLRIFRILRHYDVITILYRTYEFGFEIRVSNLVCMLNFEIRVSNLVCMLNFNSHNVEHRLRYCDMTQKQRVIF